MTQPTVEMLAGGPKPDFFREAIQERKAVCNYCNDEDADVIYVDRVDEGTVLCEEDAEQIPEDRRTREYIRISEVPWQNPPAEIPGPEGDSAEEIVREYTNHNGKVWAVLDSEGDVVRLVRPRDVKDNTLSEVSEEFAGVLLEQAIANPGNEVMMGAHLNTINNVAGNRYLIHVQIAAFRVEEISAEAAEIVVEESGE